MLKIKKNNYFEYFTSPTITSSRREYSKFCFDEFWCTVSNIGFLL